MVLGPALLAQEKRERDKSPEPPEEDEAFRTKEYSFNPIQASHELKVGNFYFKKGNYRAAADRFQEATRWNPGYAEAYRRLGDALEKWKGPKAAREAYEKFVKLDPEAKAAGEIRRKLAGKP